MSDRQPDGASKVPALTAGFWLIKILATTLGETAGDTVSMTMDLGYLVGTAFFGALLALLVAAQIRARRLHPALYWATIIASTTAGTTLADFATRSLGIGYAGGALLLLTLVMAALGAWRLFGGGVGTDRIRGPRAEGFYWLTITLSQTLGTALGDWVADDPALGYSGAALLFGGLLAVVTVLWFATRIDRVPLFWAIFILTRPLGATVGDFLDKPVASGGLAFSRPLASLVLTIAIIALVAVLPQRAGRHGHHA